MNVAEQPSSQPPAAAAAVPGAPTLNPDIRSLHQSLIQRHQTLSDLLGQATDIDDARAILGEMQEVSFRITVAGNLLFKRTTDKIDESIQSVLAAGEAIDASLREADKIRDIIKATSKFLGLVDKALDAIKLL